MSKAITNEQISKIVSMIEEHKDNPIFKSRLREKGLKLIPNRMKSLEELLNKAGYCIVPLKQEDPFLSSEDREEPCEAPPSEGPVGPAVSVKDNWKETLLHIKAASPPLHSLVLNAQVVDFKDGLLFLGFLPNSTYQMSQFNKKQNTEAFLSIARNCIKSIVSVQTIITDRGGSS